MKLDYLIAEYKLEMGQKIKAGIISDIFKDQILTQNEIDRMRYQAWRIWEEIPYALRGNAVKEK